MSNIVEGVWGLKHGFLIELVVKKRDIVVPEWYRSIIKDFSILETKSRIIVNLPLNWDGFRDGTILKIMGELNESVYIALAYVTDNRSEIVTDLEGESVDVFDVLVDGKICKKFVNKKLRVLEIIDKEFGIFKIVGYLLNLRFVEPAIKVLEVYSGGLESGLFLDAFLSKEFM